MKGQRSRGDGESSPEGWGWAENERGLESRIWSERPELCKMPSAVAMELEQHFLSPCDSQAALVTLWDHGQWLPPPSPAPREPPLSFSHITFSKTLNPRKGPWGSKEFSCPLLGQQLQKPPIPTGLCQRRPLRPLTCSHEHFFTDIRLMQTAAAEGDCPVPRTLHQRG